MTRLPPIVEAEIERAGLSYEVRHGGRHDKVFIEGRMVAVLSRGGKHGPAGSDPRAELNMRTQVRRALAEISGSADR